jgi:type IV pilus assembly protein PilQ
MHHVLQQREHLRFLAPLLALLIAFWPCVCAGEEGDEEAGAQQPTVTVECEQQPLADVLTDVGEQAGVCIVPDETVTGEVSMQLQDVSLDRCLRTMLLPRGLAWGEVDEGVFVVSEADPSSPAFAQISETEIIELDYVEAEELEALLAPTTSQFVRIAAEGNRVAITAPDALMGQFTEEIRQLDTPPEQIMIEAMVIETDRANIEDLEIFAQAEHLSLDTTTSAIAYVEQAERVLYQLLWLEQQNEAVIRANPRIVAQEGNEATVAVNTDRFFRIVEGELGDEEVRLEKIRAAIKLNITPQIAGENEEVTCRVDAEVADVTGVAANDLPIITARQAQSTVRVGDGEVIAIGGLLEENERSLVRRIPILSEIPIVGDLFKSTESRVRQREVVIFIVPHVLDPAGKFDGRLLLHRDLKRLRDEWSLPETWPRPTMDPGVNSEQTTPDTGAQDEPRTGPDRIRERFRR